MKQSEEQAMDLVDRYVRAVAKALPGLSCDDLLTHKTPMTCRAPAGQLAVGAACGDNAQCASSYCNLAGNGQCGSCGGPGEACCAGGSCGSPSLACGGHVCQACGAAGQVCCDSDACAPGLTCHMAVCG